MNGSELRRSVELANAGRPYWNVEASCMQRYTLADKSLEELLRDVESGHMAATRISAYADLPHVLAIKVAQANAASADKMARWARVAASASVASVVVAMAAVIVAIVG